MTENEAKTDDALNEETQNEDATTVENSSVDEENAQNHSDVDANIEDSDDDAFFAKSFALNASQRDDSSDADAFAGGLRSLFEAEEESDEDDEEEYAARDAAEDLSDAERIQRDLELERREALDATILQNDADFLREAGARYEAPKASDDDFEPSERSFARRALVRPESIIEAMLFVGDRENKPLVLARACELVRNLKVEEALDAIRTLNARYDRDGAPYHIVEDGGGFRMTLRAGFEDVLARFTGKTREFKLSQTAIDALALVAYRQPISLEDILAVRKSAASALSQLTKRDLVSVEKRVENGKKVSYYRTTDRFLAFFNLKSIDELPILGDVDYR